MRYVKTYQRFYAIIVLLIIFFHLYFIFLMKEDTAYLWYFDTLIATMMALFIGVDTYRFQYKRKQLEALLQQDNLITPQLQEDEPIEIARHDVELLQRELSQQQEVNADLQDYIMKWCHEVKLPLAAALLMNEQIQEKSLQQRQKEQLEKLSQQLNMALVGCRVQSTMYDLQIRPCSLLHCVRTSIQNNQFFLIRHHFALDIQITEDNIVYSDMQWLVYVLDQLMSNAIKYRKTPCELKLWCEIEAHKTILYFEDHGEGIDSQDVRRVFEKGFTGNNRHNGQYRSTGMGLYMASLIMKKLGHGLEVESKKGCYTRFLLTFEDNRDFFHLESNINCKM